MLQLQQRLHLMLKFLLKLRFLLDRRGLIRRRRFSNFVNNQTVRVLAEHTEINGSSTPELEVSQTESCDALIHLKEITDTLNEVVEQVSLSTHSEEVLNQQSLSSPVINGGKGSKEISSNGQLEGKDVTSMELDTVPAEAVTSVRKQKPRTASRSSNNANSSSDKKNLYPNKSSSPISVATSPAKPKLSDKIHSNRGKATKADKSPCKKSLIASSTDCEKDKALRPATLPPHDNISPTVKLLNMRLSSNATHTDIAMKKESKKRTHSMHSLPVPVVAEHKKDMTPTKTNLSEMKSNNISVSSNSMHADKASVHRASKSDQGLRR